MGRIENLGRIEISDARLAQLEHALVRLGGHGSGLLRDARPACAGPESGSNPLTRIQEFFFLYPLGSDRVGAL